MASEEKNGRKKLNFLGLMTNCNFCYKQHLTAKQNTSLNATNWETKHQKYENIFDILMKEYPDDKEMY